MRIIKMSLPRRIDYVSNGLDLSSNLFAYQSDVLVVGLLALNKIDTQAGHINLDNMQ